MFKKYFFHRLLYILQRNIIPKEKDIWFDNQTKVRVNKLFKTAVSLQKYKDMLNGQCKELFDTLESYLLKIHQLLRKRNYPELNKIDIDFLNKLIIKVYECFHSTELKKKQTITEIKKRLEFYGVDPDIEVSASHRPERGEALAIADIEKFSKKRLFTYFHGTDHPSRSWYHIGGFFRTAYKSGLIEVSKYLPPQTKIYLLKLIGVYIGGNVTIGQNVQFDYFHPELIRIEDNVVIGNNTKLWTHDFSIKRYAFAPLTIHEKAIIEDNCFIGPVEIGKNVRVKSHSVVLRNIPERVKVYDNADPKYIQFLEEAISGTAYEKLVHKFVHWTMSLCKILPYDPVPKDIPLIGKLPFIEGLPTINLKNRLHKLLGVKIKGHITTAPRVYIDAIHPELVEINDKTLIGDGVIFRPYDLNGNPQRIIVGKNCKIGSESIIMGCIIGDNSQINIRSVVYGNIPKNVIAGGVPAKEISKNSAAQPFQ
jgi:acetyltransferase-like isoleucine patch superfamily enzyme